MYINPFWCGVIATFLAEVVAILIYAAYLGFKGRKEGEDEES